MERIGEPETRTLFGDEEIQALRELLQSGRTLARGPDVSVFERIWFRRQVALPIGPRLSGDNIKRIIDSIQYLYTKLRPC